MLDREIIDELKNLYAKLHTEVVLEHSESNHENQKDLLDLISDLSQASPMIKVRSSGETTHYPELTLYVGEKKTGIHFLGVPGGHEFSSLALAILNSNGQGRLPDEMIQERIKSLKGPIQLHTFISLSCENCPEVVQALNQMSLIHPDFSHTMIDGQFMQEEIQRLKIHGVPSVMRGEKLLSAGKSTLIDLLSKLEAEFGSTPRAVTARDLGTYDVVVLGAGPAGASAAIYSARKGLKTAIIADKIGGQVQDTKGIENLISVTYTEGPKLAAELLAHVRHYDIKLLEHRRVKSVTEDKFVTLESGETLSTKSLIVATGAKWRELNIPGEKEYLGHGVAFCPHCDGPSFKGKDIAVIGGGNSGVEAAIDLAGIVKSVTLFEFNPELKADKVLVDKLMSLPNVSVVKNARTHQILGENGEVTALEYEDRASGKIHTKQLAGIFVQIGLVPNSSFIKDVVATNRFGEIIVDEKCRTNVQGIYGAGDVTTVPYKQIVIAMGEGAKAGLSSFEDLMLRH